jgi:opacity protein-like surface antigen
MNKRNILIVAMLAMILMGSVVLSAAVINVHNVYPGESLEIEYHNGYYLDSQEVYITSDYNSSTYTFTYVTLVNGTNTIKVTQGNRSVTETFYYDGNAVDITLPGPWKQLPGQEDPQ